MNQTNPIAELRRHRQWSTRVLNLRSKEIAALRTENERLREHLKRGQTLINEMDLRMPDQATEDADGWINSYRIPVGPWHRILGWARGGW